MVSKGPVLVQDRVWMWARVSGIEQVFVYKIWNKCIIQYTNIQIHPIFYLNYIFVFGYRYRFTECCKNSAKGYPSPFSLTFACYITIAQYQNQRIKIGTINVYISLPFVSSCNHQNLDVKQFNHHKETVPSFNVLYAFQFIAALS